MAPDPDDAMSGVPAPAFPRRTILAGLLAVPLTVAAASPLPPRGGVAFRISRGDRAVGSHSVAFSHAGERLVVAIAIDIAVRFGALTLFRLTHRATETWQGGRFERIESRTDNDGRSEWMWAVRQDDAVLVDGNASGPWRAPADALPATYWNPALLAGPMLDARDGRLVNARVSAAGVEDVPVEGGRVRARRYVLSDDADLSIWYDLDGNWAHMQMRRLGSLITYERA